MASSSSLFDGSNVLPSTSREQQPEPKPRGKAEGCAGRACRGRSEGWQCASGRLCAPTLVPVMNRSAGTNELAPGSPQAARVAAKAATRVAIGSPDLRSCESSHATRVGGGRRRHVYPRSHK